MSPGTAAPLVCHSERQSRNPNRTGQPCPQYRSPICLSFRAASRNLNQTGLPCPQYRSPLCLSFRATVEESQPHGATVSPVPQPPLSVIPSDSRGIPTVVGGPSWTCPDTLVPDPERGAVVWNGQNGWRVRLGFLEGLGMTGLVGLRWVPCLPRTVGIPRLSLGMTD